MFESTGGDASDVECFTHARAPYQHVCCMVLILCVRSVPLKFTSRWYPTHDLRSSSPPITVSFPVLPLLCAHMRLDLACMLTPNVAHQRSRD